MVEALLAARAAQPQASAWVPSHTQRRGHPLLLGAACYERFRALAPDQPARSVVRSLAAEGSLIHVEVEDLAVLMNANTPAELERWGGRIPE